MNNFRYVKPLTIYKHFKGKYYAVMGITELLEPSEKITCDGILECNHTEEKETIPIIRDIDDKFYHPIDVSDEPLVLYKSLYDDSGIYARPVSMFLSEVDYEKHPDIKQKYRFEEV